MKVRYKTVTEINKEQEHDIELALYIKVGNCELRLSEEGGELKIIGEGVLKITPHASNLITVKDSSK